jgi:hypothetical protein
VVDDKGNVHLVVGNEFEGEEDEGYGEEDDENMLMGDQNEEEFLQMMQQEEMMGRGHEH